MTDHELDQHDACDPDVCFTAKLRYWRQNGAPGVVYQGGQRFFHEKTIRSEQAKIIAEGKAKGNELVPYRSIHGDA